MNFRILKKKYRKMYGKNPPKRMKRGLIKTMIRPLEYEAVTAIGVSVTGFVSEAAGENLKNILFVMVGALRKEMRKYECNTANLVNTTRILAERRKAQK